MLAPAPATPSDARERSRAEKGEKKGWLWKRAHFTRRWRPAWFHLEGARLRYSEHQEKPAKTINLVGAVMETTESDDTFGWTITPEDKKRCFYLRADSPEEQQDWMQTICEAQICSAQNGTNACVLQ